MSKRKVLINDAVVHALDTIREEYGGSITPRIEAGLDDAGRMISWVVYLPNECGCICDSFEDAADMVREWLKPRRRK